MKKEKSIVECIKEYFKKCPYIESLAEINVDYLNMEGDGDYWSIEKSELPIILKKSVTGKRTIQYSFVLATRVFTSPLTDSENIKSLQVFENIAEWMYQNSKGRNKILPILNDDETSTSIEATRSGFLYGVNKDTKFARYQMPCKLVYEKK